MTAKTNWRRLESKMRRLFRECGCSAKKTTVEGPGKVKYEVDCWVTFKALGLPAKWIVECKDWGSRIPQEVAASLRQRVTDTGADKGILVCPSGFQKGTIHQAEVSSLVLVTPDELEEKLWGEFRQLATEGAFKQIRQVKERIVTYRLRLEDYLYAHENAGEIDKEYAAYERLASLIGTLAMTELHLEMWEAGLPSIGPPTHIPDMKGDVEGKTDFEDDREMLRHVLRLISDAKKKTDKEGALVASLPRSPRSPDAPPPYKGPRYLPKPPKKKR